MTKMKSQRSPFPSFLGLVHVPQSLGIGLASLLVPISATAEVPFKVKPLPIQPVQVGTTVGDFHINGPGHVLWVEAISPEGTSGTYNIYRPTGAANPQDDVERIPAPTGKAGLLRGFNDSDNFVVDIAGLLNLDHTLYLWQGGGFVPLRDPNPMVEPAGRMTHRAAVLNVSAYGSPIGLHSGPDADPGAYFWTAAGSPVKHFETPSSVYSGVGTPNARGTRLATRTQGGVRGYLRADGFTPFPVPTDQGYNFSLNDKDQVAGSGTTRSWLYLPTPDYGLPPGLSIFDQFTNVLLTNTSTLLARTNGLPDTWIYDNGEWQRMAVTDPEDPGFVANIGVGLIGASDKGDVLVRQVDQHGTRTLFFERDDPGFRVEMTLPDSFQEIAASNDVLVTVTSNRPETITVSFEDGAVLATTDSEALSITNPTVSPFSLTAAEPSRTFTAQVIPRKLGKFSVMSTSQATVGGTPRSASVSAFITARLDLEDAGGFEAQELGTTVTSPPDVVSDDVIAGWRVYNVDSANADFSVAVENSPSEGEHSLRMTVNNTNGTMNYAMDQFNPLMHTPIEQGSTYLLSFDAAWISGATTNNLLFLVQEFDSSGAQVGNGPAERVSVASSSYQTHTIFYRPVNANAAQFGLYLSPMQGTAGSTSIRIDNIGIKPAPLVVNADFELTPLGTSGGGGGAFVDATTFLNWRLFSVGSPPISSLNATVVDAGGFSGGQPGSRAIQLDVNNTGTPAGQDYGFDNDNARVPVTTGEKYTLSFDLALTRRVGGSLNFQVTIAEFDAAGAFTGTQGGFPLTLPLDQSFHRYSFDYTVANAATRQVGIAFRPITGSGAESTLVLDNVDFAPHLVAYARASSDLPALWLSDDDGDGVPFGTEFAFGTDPFAADAGSARAPEWIAAENRLRFGYNQDAAEFGAWVVQRGSDLVNFDDVCVYDGRSRSATFQLDEIDCTRAGTGDSQSLSVFDQSASSNEVYFYRVVSRLFGG